MDWGQQQAVIGFQYSTPLTQFVNTWLILEADETLSFFIQGQPRQLFYTCTDTHIAPV